MHRTGPTSIPKVQTRHQPDCPPRISGPRAKTGGSDVSQGRPCLSVSMEEGPLPSYSRGVVFALRVPPSESPLAAELTTTLPSHAGARHSTAIAVNGPARHASRNWCGRLGREWFIA